MIVAGLDVGTTSVKGLALDTDAGRVVASATEGYPFDTPRPGWTEQDPELWWRASEKVLASLSSAAGELGGIGLSGQMHGLVALDSSDSVLRPALLWNDQRTAAEAAEIEERVGGLSALVEATGNRSLTGFTAPKLLWMARNEPELYARVAHVMLPKDYVRLRLCGEHATDVTDASGTLWFDVGERRWSERVLGVLEVDSDWLPPAEESAVVTGTTSDGVPVAAGAGDQGAGALGVGVDRPGPVSVVLGTSGVVLSALPAYAAEPEGRVQASCHALPGAWFGMGVILSAAGSLRWLRDVTGDVPFGGLDVEAEKWGPGVEGLTFLPYLTGERTPHFDPDARGAFAGLTVRHDRGALARAVLEGVAFGMRDALDLVASLGGHAAVGRVSGGGAKSDLWMRIVASVLELPLERVAVDEGAAYGAALLGGVAGGAWSNAEEAVKACVSTHATIDPVQEWIQPYREAREKYRALYPALKEAAAPEGAAANQQLETKN
ncbi:MAG TPA: xylulokinase [Thermoleophilaceae bacterium]